MSEATNIVAQLWQTQRRTRGAPPKAVPARFHADCVISYVPTGVIYRGHREIEGLLDQLRSGFYCVEEYKILNTVCGERDAIEEAILTIRHEKTLEYLLPGIKDTGRTLILPMVTISSFRDDKLASQRVYWDHASLLRQAGLLPQTVRGKGANEIAIVVAGHEVGKVVEAAFEVLGGGEEEERVSGQQRPKQTVRIAEPEVDGEQEVGGGGRGQQQQQQYQQQQQHQQNDRSGGRNRNYIEDDDRPIGRNNSQSTYQNQNQNNQEDDRPIRRQSQSNRQYEENERPIQQQQQQQRRPSQNNNRNNYIEDERPIGRGKPVEAADPPAHPRHRPSTNPITGEVSPARQRPVMDYDQSANANVANTANPVTGNRQSVRLHAPPGGVSSFSLSDGTTEPVYRAEPGQQRTASQTPKSALEDIDPRVAADMVTARNSYAQRDRGSILFQDASKGGDFSTEASSTSKSTAAMVAEKKARGGSPPTPRARSGSTSGGMNPVTGKRVSVKLHAPPGGASNIHFG
ncbi:hypothetical protein DFS34DRAFT_404057 [Phlyctochytrium arcticum]|nr:hypothetical protein DFS34DRAFT_404057 [Phlyctochytrium arcticum]